MPPSVIIDCFPESAARYRRGYAVVAIDVIRATTTAITAVSMGRRCFPVPDMDAALELAGRLRHPLLAGELGGDMPEGFDLSNSPAAIVERTDCERPMILLSSSGSRLMHEAGRCEAAYLACFRNYTAVAACLAGAAARVAVIGAGSRNEFREEDQMCCAWIAGSLMDAGYAPEDARTREMAARWRGATPEACMDFRSAQYLRRSGQQPDLDFVLAHINDLDAVFRLERGEVVENGVPAARNGKLSFYAYR